jgi:periplasmic divalent cation tolerance protein
MTDKIVVFSTCAGEEEGARIGRKLVEEKVAACVTMLPGARSMYRWAGKMEEESECLLVIKTSRAKFDELRHALEKAHSYEVPEMVALQVIEGSPNYLAWLEEQLR